MQTSKKRRHIHQPSLGVKADFESLLQRFAAAGTVRYEKFAALWREMRLSLYCCGRQTQREAREFVEECFHIAVQFWLPPSSFLVRAGALYLLYGLYYYQLVAPRVKIRMTHEDFNTIQEFHREAREQQHLDLDYIFQKLLVGKAFHFVANQNELYPTFKDKEEHQTIIPDSLKEEINVVEEIFSETSLGQLDLVHDQYHKMKIALNGEDADKPDSSLDIIHTDILQGIKKTLQTHRWRQKSAGHIVELPSDKFNALEGFGEQDSGQMSAQKSLKKKAFTTTMGYYKSWKKGQGTSGEDTAGDSTDNNELLSPEKKKSSRGRHHFVELYDQDEMDLGSVETELNEVYSMPDLDKILMPTPFVSKDDTEGTSRETSGKGKAPVKGKVKRKRGRPPKRKPGDDNNTDKTMRVSDGKQKRANSDSRKKSVKIESEACSPSKKIKTELPDESFGHMEAANESKPATNKGVKKRSPKANPSLKSSSITTKKKAGKQNELLKEEKPKKPSAQDILFQSLKFRKKQKMEKKKKK